MNNLFLQRFISLCKEKNIKPQQLRHYINVKSATITKWTKGELLPNTSVLVEMSTYFNCSIDYLLGLSDVKEIITSDELKHNIPKEDKYLLDQYCSLSSNNKSIVDYIFGMEQEEVELTKIYHFPVFFQSAAAGIGQLSNPYIYKMEEFVLPSLPKKFSFGMYIEGDSMEEYIYNNDIVLIDPSAAQIEELHDEVVVALFGEELICKRLHVNSFKRVYDFNSDNSSEGDKSRKNQKQSDFKLIGKVVDVIHR